MRMADGKGESSEGFASGKFRKLVEPEPAVTNRAGFADVASRSEGKKTREPA